MITEYVRDSKIKGYRVEVICNGRVVHRKYLLRDNYKSLKAAKEAATEYEAKLQANYKKPR
jgi:hypothetical protein